MFYDWFDGPVGRHGDKYFLAKSGLNRTLQQCQLGNHRQFTSYNDKGYERDTHIRCAAHGPARVTQRQHLDNWIMSKTRISVEWGYGKVKTRCPYLLRPHHLKLQLMDVAQVIRVSVLLTNAHTCLHQSITGLYFNCAAPTLTEYFA
jgi:hypothetical protein